MKRTHARRMLTVAVVRAGAYYAQFQVFDYSGDGRAEVAMKTGRRPVR